MTGEALRVIENDEAAVAPLMLELGRRARAASRAVALSPTSKRNAALAAESFDPLTDLDPVALAFRIEPAYLGRPAGWLRSYQLYGFYDGGKVWYCDDPATGERPGESLASAGFGARAFLGADVSATLEVAWPLTRPIASYREDGDDPRILGSMVIRF